jgi:uncharacterized protein (TIGR02270 family)
MESAPVTGVERVLEQHAEQGAFLWLLRERLLVDPVADLAALAKHDARIEAHLEGLRLGGPPAWQICVDALRWQGSGELFVAAVLAAESGDERRCQTVLETASRSHSLARGLASALAWLGLGPESAPIPALLASERPALRRAAIAAAAVQRRDPGPTRAEARVLDHAAGGRVDGLALDRRTKHNKGRGP